MKLVADFTKFLDREVNLDETRIATLKARVQSLIAFLDSSDLKVRIERYSPQGSLAHKTIIKPPRDNGFDADLVVFVSPSADWDAADYVLEFNRVFMASGDYKDRVQLGTRCITLVYAGDFNIDVVPCVVRRVGANATFEVCNRKENIFEPTAPEAYTAWLEGRNVWTGNKLREVTRLLKYLRDIKGTFTCKSILLTTLLGERITQADTLYRSTHFPDLPTALRTLVGRLDDYLQARPHLHDVRNPVLPSESFIRHWDDDKYATFREMVHKYRGWIDDAYLEADEAESVAKWRRVFGDDFGKGRAARAVAENAVVPMALNAVQVRDAVELVASHGPGVLAAVRPVFPWMKTPPWRVAANRGVLIQASAHGDRTGNSQIGNFQSGTIMRPNVQILFEAQAANGIPFASSKEFDVKWQVVNTDRAAWMDGGLRGEFYPSDTRGKRWEYTKYRGVHWVQAFVIRQRDKACVGKSDRFFVVIE